MSNDASKEVFTDINAVEEAESRAYRRGVKTAELEGTLRRHFEDDDRRFGEFQREQAVTSSEVTEVKRSVQKVEEKLDQKDAVREALAKVAKEAAEKQVSTRQFVIGLITVVGALGGIDALVRHL